MKIVTERLRTEAIGNPEWLQSKDVFEYPNQTIEVAVVLKIIRAAQGIFCSRSTVPRRIIR